VFGLQLAGRFGDRVVALLPDLLGVRFAAVLIRLAVWSARVSRRRTGARRASVIVISTDGVPTLEKKRGSSPSR
jgi:hypothetical protein